METSTYPPPRAGALHHESIIRYLLERMMDARNDNPPESVRGTARVWSPADLVAALEAAPAIKLTSYRALEAATEIPRTTLTRAMTNQDRIRRVAGSVKPYLSSDRIHKRIEFALSFVDNAAGGSYRFNSMNDTIHNDEKWFYLWKKRKS
ncbi:hypothetical protein PPTG_20107 [Phytophthora nicotianae INRA-310]|uniref:Transposase Tc1-like domain-containing protein n=1 Tax=Phytophthora nicotianae (strain INRA-310) TaxID=761204 RepID=W2PAF9_PHYN3|nr:hypothetical protein PPTG_20107 [Phytophthora nicotianae INRA-310]ETM97655.1 hypothetical protein PPTG_20107 [Phytophthora nicotianae INRA-310]